MERSGSSGDLHGLSEHSRSLGPPPLITERRGLPPTSLPFRNRSAAMYRSRLTASCEVLMGQSICLQTPPAATPTVMDRSAQYGRPRTKARPGPIPADVLPAATPPLSLLRTAICSESAARTLRSTAACQWRPH